MSSLLVWFCVGMVALVSIILAFTLFFHTSLYEVFAWFGACLWIAIAARLDNWLKTGK